MNLAIEEKKITEFIKTEVKRLGKKGVTIGLSGGLDSTVTAYLSVKALGQKKVHALILPEKHSNPVNVRHAEKVANLLKIKTIKKNITRELTQLSTYDILKESLINNQSLITKLIKSVKKISPSIFQAGFNSQYNKSKGTNKLVQKYSNKVHAFAITKTRLRMIHLYQHAILNNQLVIGTTDKTEWAYGVYDQYGDGASDLNPIKHLYKTEIKQLAKHLSIPKEIQNKPSSGDLGGNSLPNEVLIGLTYEELDPILKMISQGKDLKNIVKESGQSLKTIKVIKKQVELSEKRRELPKSLL